VAFFLGHPVDCKNSFISLISSLFYIRFIAFNVLSLSFCFVYIFLHNFTRFTYFNAPSNQGDFKDNVTGDGNQAKKDMVVGPQGTLRGPDCPPFTMQYVYIVLNINGKTPMGH